MANQTIDNKIDEVIAELSFPMSASESADGWTPESKKSIKTFFEDLKKKLQSGEELPPLNISVWLDHWGIVSGSVLEKAAQISNELRSRRSPLARPYKTLN